MVALTSTFFTLAVFCSTALAAPWPLHSRQQTHRIRSLPNGLQVKSYHPSSTYQTYGDGIAPPTGFAASSFKDSGLAFIGQQLGSAQVQFRSSHDGETAKHVYVNQEFNGIRVANAVAHTSFNSAGKIVAFSSSFVTPANDVPGATPVITQDKAIEVAKSKAGATATDKALGLEYFTKDDDTVALTHVVTARVDGNGHLIEAYVDAQTAELVAIVDFTTQLTYLALPITKQSPEEGIESIVDPEDKDSSPSGWVTNGTTSGNNAIVYKKSQSGVTKESSSAGFSYKWTESSAPTAGTNLDAARTNAFYIVNRYHDILYRYGFTEKAFNFQKDNFNKGGKGNDQVLVSVQDSDGTDNADFTTPADGESGQMRMFLWDQTKPERDGALESDIIVHEHTHGLTNRLTGGGTGRCLTTTEAGGMGEGWSDTIAFWTEQTTADVKDYTMGTFVMGNSAGIRSHPYSLSKSVNPYTYATVKTKNEVHDIGEVWANMLVNVYGALVAVKGFDANAANDATSTKGNAIFLHLFVDSLSLQPCNPTFVSARDAWIQADKNRYNGANTCTLWTAFASRGLGQGATTSKVDNSEVPAECNSTSTPTSTETSEPTQTETETTETETDTGFPTETETSSPDPTETDTDEFPTETETDFPTSTDTDDFPWPTETDTWTWPWRN